MFCLAAFWQLFPVASASLLSQAERWTRISKQSKWSVVNPKRFWCWRWEAQIQEYEVHKETTLTDVGKSFAQERATWKSNQKAHCPLVRRSLFGIGSSAQFFRRVVLFLVLKGVLPSDGNGQKNPPPHTQWRTIPPENCGAKSQETATADHLRQWQNIGRTPNIHEHLRSRHPSIDIH